MNTLDQETFIGGGSDQLSPLIFWDGYGLSGTYSGILTHAIELFKGMKNLGIEPIIVGEKGLERHFFGSRVVFIEGAASRLKINKIKFVWPLLVERKIQTMAFNKPHIVHGLSNFNVPLSSPKTNERRVLTVHDVIPFLDPSSVSTSYAIQFKLALSRAVNVVDKIICVSNWTMQSLLSFFPHIEDRCVIIYNGVHKKVTSSTLKDLSGAIELLSIARFEKYKRLDLLLEICQNLPNIYSLNLVTDAKGREFCEKQGAHLIRNHKLFVYVGLSPERLQDLYRKSHIYLHPSLYEGFNIPAVEAVVNGLPVVYSKGIGTEEIIGPEVGISIDKHESSERWVEAVLSCKDFLGHNSWILKARDAVEKLPTWEQNALLTSKIYQEIS